MISLLLPLFNFTPNLATRQVSAATEKGSSTPPAPQSLTVPAVVDPHLPSLSAQMQVTPRWVAVGDTFTMTLTVSNSAPDAASNLVATLPLPQGVIKLGASAPQFASGLQGQGAQKGIVSGNMPAVSATVPGALLD